MKRHIFVPLLAMGLLAGCMPQDRQVSTLQNRINQQEQTIQQLNSQLSGVQPAQADTWSQVQELRQEVAMLKGQLDNMNYSASSIGGATGLADRVVRHDAALRAVEKQFGMNLNLDAPTPTGMYGNIQPTTPGLTPPPVTPAMTGQNQTAPQIETIPAVSADVAKVLYESGVEAFNASKYQEGLNAFDDFIRTYPKHELVSNAWFWKGECHYQLQDYANAALDYEEVIKNFPNSNKIAAAYLKQGMSFERVNKKDVARYRYEDLIKKFPNSPEAARAKTLLAS